VKYKYFFVTSGKGLSITSPLNAFDNALVDAGIGQCNLVKVSSILPEGAKEITPYEISPGEITHCVLAMKKGKEGEVLSAGIGWAFGIDSKNHKHYGVVAEKGESLPPQQLEKRLLIKLEEMGRVRGMKLGKPKIRIASIPEVPPKHYGCVIVALIYSSTKHV